MPPPSPTPISLLEEFFEVDLTPRWVRAMRRGVEPPRWIEFAKFYRARMEAGFAEEFLQPRESDVRVYFEPTLSEAWEDAVTRRSHSTPLLGVRPRLSFPVEDETSALRALEPLKKHLLFANSVYIRDSFYYCFDGVADLRDDRRWDADPNVRNLVEMSIQGIQEWLTMLVLLRPLVESRALVFMPYYVTPSFPYAGMAPQLKEQYARLAIPPDPYVKAAKDVSFDLGNWSVAPTIPASAGPAQPSERWFPDKAVAAWLNARLLGLSPVFPTRTMFDWARGLHFVDEAAAEVMTNLVTIQWLPFGHRGGLDVRGLAELRADEEVFRHVREAIGQCLRYAEATVNPDTNPELVADGCKQRLHDALEKYERKSVLRILEEHPVAAAGFAIAMGAAFFLAHVPPVPSILIPSLLTPQFARIVEKHFDPRRRAYRRLHALL